MNIYQPEHIIGGNHIHEDLVVCPFRDVVNRLKEAKTTAEKFLEDLKVCRDMPNSMLSPVSGILEQGQLDFINEMLGLDK